MRFAVFFFRRRQRAPIRQTALVLENELSLMDSWLTRAGLLGLPAQAVVQIISCRIPIIHKGESRQ